MDSRKFNTESEEMKEEVGILSKEIEKHIKAIEWHLGQIRHNLKQIQIQVESKKRYIPLETSESTARCVECP